MKSRRGQVALYLIATLVAICVLMLMNVGIYLFVAAKNRAMNAGDAAALAVARHQGSLLNSIGQMNIDHLRAALEDDEDACCEIMTNQLRTCFLGPIDALVVGCGGYSYLYGCISAGNKAAQDNGAARSKEMEDALLEYAQGIRESCAMDTVSHPEPWAGAWMEYAQKLESAAHAGIWAGPGNNMSMLGTFQDRDFLPLDQEFYEAIAGECWCWFKLNNKDDWLTHYADPSSWPMMPDLNDADRRLRSVNSMVYSLHLQVRVGSAVELLGTNLICRITDATESDVANSRLIDDPTQEWMFYDMGTWRRWWEIDPYGEWQFPVVGQVKPEYDTRGCAAVCRTEFKIFDITRDGGDCEVAWVAAAKPFGTVEDEDGEVACVTALREFVIPSFDSVRLVPLSVVSGDNGTGEFLDTANLRWMRHVRKHLPQYLSSGCLIAASSEGCWYCQQLVLWEHPSFRRKGVRWLKLHGNECVRPTPGPGSRGGGAPYAH